MATVNTILGSLAEQFLAWDRRRFIATVRSVLVDRDPVLGALPELKVPVLIVSGKEDHTLYRRWDDCSCYQPAGRRYWPAGAGS